MTEADFSIEKHAIISILQGHVGEQTAIKQGDLLLELHREEYLSIESVPNTRTLLDIIHTMRREGYVIASCSHGYFLPVNFEEANNYVNIVLRSRAHDLLMTIRAQRRAIQAQYSGQMELFE